MRNWFTSRLMATLMFVLAAAVAVSGQITVTLYDSNPAGSAPAEIRKELIAEFEAANPDIKVEHVMHANYNVVQERTMVSWAGGMAPNIVIFEQSRWFGPVLEGLILPLDEYIENDPSISLDDIYPGILDHLTWDGQVWGLPYQLSTPLIFYNKGLFARAGVEPRTPATWDEMLQISRAVSQDTNNDGVNDVWGMSFYGWGWLFEAWLGQNGARLASVDGSRYTFDSNEAIEAMEFVQALIIEHDAAIGAPSATVTSEFWAGNVGMVEQSTASLTTYTARAQQNNIDMGVGALACNVECYAPIGGGNLFMINTGTKEERDATWRLMSFLGTADNLARMAAATGFMSGRQSSFDSEYLQHFFATQDGALTTYEQLNVAMPRGKVPTWPTFASEISSFAGRQWRGANVRAELTELARKANIGLDAWYAQQNQ